MDKKFHIQKERNDPAGVLRASTGGTPKIGFYCVYRGEKLQIIAMLEKILERLKNPSPEDSL
jgi:hypothetical protein